MRLLLTASEGTAELVAEEAKELGLDVTDIRRDGVEVKALGKGLAKALVWLRTAERILVHMHSFECGDAAGLYKGAMDTDWNAWVDSSVSIAVNATGQLPRSEHATKNPLKTHVFAAQVAKDGVVDSIRAATGARPDVAPRDPDVRIVARFFGRRCNLFLDASGAPLNWRGYRHSSVKAPLTETTAAVLLADAGYEGDRPLLDPMCGSGTIAIEAAMIAAGIAPGGERMFGVERWPKLPQPFVRALAQERNKARASRRAAQENPQLVVQAQDVDKEALEAANNNARMAGVRGWIEFVHEDVRNLANVMPGTLIATNPPYGERIGDGLVQLYKAMGASMAAAEGCDIAILDGHEDFPEAFGLQPTRSTKLRNGPLKVLLHHVSVEG